MPFLKLLALECHNSMLDRGADDKLLDPSLIREAGERASSVPLCKSHLTTLHIKEALL